MVHEVLSVNCKKTKQIKTQENHLFFYLMNNNLMNDNNTGFLKHNTALAETVYPKATECPTEDAEVLMSSGTDLDCLFLVGS